MTCLVLGVWVDCCCLLVVWVCGCVVVVFGGWVVVWFAVLVVGF